MTTFSIQSFGCRVNQAEAFSWVNDLQQNGFVYVEDFLKSDLILVNSCTLTSRADRDVRGFIRKIARENPKARMILTGCYADAIPGDIRDFEQVVKLIPNRSKDSLVRTVTSLFGRSQAVSPVSYKSRALVKVQDGCDYSCTFCVIPSVRGKSVSVERHRILEQVRAAVDLGYQEVVLTGVHLCLYGLDRDPREALLELLLDILGIPGLGRVRLSSLDPRFLKGDLLEFLGTQPKVCPHYHLSLQYGSDRILHRMGRNVSVGSYRNIMESLRESCPDASLGADIIVGFPGEEERDFEDTFCFLDESPLTYFHVFPYSPRKGTAAAEWHPVNDRVKKERAGQLRRLSEKKNLAFRKDFIGRELDAVVIHKEASETRVLTGNYIDVKIPFSPNEVRDRMIVRITKADRDSTYGESFIKGAEK
ncbi:tRNA (N(6)-L-threonylcarbamoyladenosine(37)-C(2))-methylthiotransferase MtaB [Acidobacteriota bacterium]